MDMHGGGVQVCVSHALISDGLCRLLFLLASLFCNGLFYANWKDPLNWLFVFIPTAKLCKCLHCTKFRARPDALYFYLPIGWDWHLLVSVVEIRGTQPSKRSLGFVSLSLSLSLSLSCVCVHTHTLSLSVSCSLSLSPVVFCSHLSFFWLHKRCTFVHPPPSPPPKKNGEFMTNKKFNAWAKQKKVSASTNPTDRVLKRQPETFFSTLCPILFGVAPCVASCVVDRDREREVDK